MTSYTKSMLTKRINKEQQKKLNMCLKLNEYGLFIIVIMTTSGA